MLLRNIHPWSHALCSERFVTGVVDKQIALFDGIGMDFGLWCQRIREQSVGLASIAGICVEPPLWHMHDVCTESLLNNIISKPRLKGTTRNTKLTSNTQIPIAD